MYNTILLSGFVLGPLSGRVFVDLAFVVHVFNKIL